MDKRNTTKKNLDIVRRACSKIRYSINPNKISNYTGLKWITCKNHLEILEMLSILYVDEAGTYGYLGLTADFFDRYVLLEKERINLFEANKNLISSLNTINAFLNKIKETKRGQ